MKLAQTFSTTRLEAQIGSWLLVLSVVGYPPIGLAATVFNLPRELTSIPFRFAILILSLLLILRLWQRGWPRGVGMLVFFWLIYFLRLLWDWNDGLPKMDEAVVFFVGTVVVPGLALAFLGAESIDWRLTATRSLWIGAVFCAAAAASFHFGLGRESEAISMAGRLEFDTVNPITIGHSAVTTILAALCLASCKESNTKRVWLAAACVPALIALALSGARGPVVSLVICVVSLLLMVKQKRLLFVAFLAGFVLVMQTENDLARRFMALLEPTLEDESAIERLSLIRNALQQFVESPLLGGTLLDTEYFSYPHNLFLEALMATGIVGALALMAVLSRSFVRAVQLLRQGELFIPLVLLQYFIAAQFSGAIWGWSAMWVPLAAIVSRGHLSGRSSVARRQRPMPLSSS